MRFSFILLSALFAAGTASSSCTAIARTAGKLTSNKYAEARSGTVWIVPPEQLEPPSLDDRTVYISFRNLSDADVDLTSLLKQVAQDQGWSVTNDPRSAKYRLRAQARFFGEVDPESGGLNKGEALGWIAGAAVGGATWALVGDATDSNLAGGVAGAATGTLAGVGLSNASETREWALITDFVLEEYSPEEVEFALLSSSSRGGTTVAGMSGARSSEGGGSSSGNSKSGTMTRTSHYFPHGIRLSTWANQMNMSEDEAMPLILERTRKVVTQLLPM